MSKWPNPCGCATCLHFRRPQRRLYKEEQYQPFVQGGFWHGSSVAASRHFDHRPDHVFICISPIKPRVLVLSALPLAQVLEQMELWRHLPSSDVLGHSFCRQGRIQANDVLAQGCHVRLHFAPQEHAFGLDRLIKSAHQAAQSQTSLVMRRPGIKTLAQIQSILAQVPRARRLGLKLRPTSGCPNALDCELALQAGGVFFLEHPDVGMQCRSVRLERGPPRLGS